MSSDRPDNRVRFSDLNWFGKSVYAGATMLRFAAKAIDSTADRVNQIAEESREAYLREIDPNIEDAKIIEETPRDERSSDH